jgi:hypothetical protein
MDAALIVITLVSLGLTAALLVYAARLQREARERSEARVLALSEEIHRGTPATPPSLDLPLAQLRAAVGVSRDHSADLTAPEERVPARQVAATNVATPSEDRIGLASAASTVASTLFDDQHESTIASHRGAMLVIAAVVVTVIAASLYSLGGRVESTVAQAAPVVPSLELVALQHTRKGDTLSVSGTVRNPNGAAARTGLTALVFVFDGHGTFVTSGRAPVDYQVLAPGDESPFVVEVPHAARAARYRVSFRAARNVVPHLDRRDAEQRIADPPTTRP